MYGSEHEASLSALLKQIAGGGAALPAPPPPPHAVGVAASGAGGLPTSYGEMQGAVASSFAPSPPNSLAQMLRSIVAGQQAPPPAPAPPPASEPVFSPSTIAVLQQAVTGLSSMGLQLSVAPAPGVTCTPEMQRVIDALGLPATTTSAPPRRDPPALSLPPPGPLLPDPVLPPTGAMGFPVSLPQPSALAMTASPVARPVADAYRPNGESEDRGDADRTEEVRAVKRTRLVWTPELHNRFVAAVNQLGIDNAVPKAILQVMNVDGLTRENVASHLQKYRLTLKRDVDRTSGRNGRSPAPAGSSQSSEPSSSQGGGRGRKRARKPSYGREAEAPPAARFADYAPLLAALQGTHAET